MPNQDHTEPAVQPQQHHGHVGQGSQDRVSVSGIGNHVGHAPSETTSEKVPPNAEPEPLRTAEDITAPAMDSSNSSDPEASAGDDNGKPRQNADPAKDGDEPDVQRTRLETIVIVTSLCAALFLAALDVTIVTTAVPVISEDLNSSAGYIWIGSAYLLSNASCAPTWGKISDIWGRKPILLAAIGVFWVGSLLCGAAVDMGMLIGARAFQGIGGGGIIVLVNICISDLFSVRDRGFYFGLVGVVWAISSAVGPVIGGIFASEVTWRWCFYINLPISGAGMVLLFFVLKLHNPRTPVARGLKAIDWLGSLTIIGGTVMLLFGLEFGGVSYPWGSPTIVCLIVFGVVTIGLFVLVEARFARYPVVPLHLFSDRSNVAAFLTAFSQAFVFISGSYYLPLYFQGVLALDPLLSGAYLLPYVVGLSIVSALAGFIIRKTGNYTYLITGGMAVAALGFGLLVDLPPGREGSDLAKIILYQVVAGIGIGPNFQAPLIALQNNVEPRDIASATATFGFIRQMANAVSIVIGGVTFNNEMDRQHGRLTRLLGQDVADLLSGDSAASSVGVVAGLQGEDGRVARGAYLSSLSTMYIVYAAFAGFGLFVSLFIRKQRLSRDHKEHKTGLKTLRSRTDREGKGVTSEK